MTRNTGRSDRMTSPVEWCSCKQQHYPGASYYVSVVDGNRWVLAAGPFSTHAQALGYVDPVRELVLKKYDYQGRAWFYGYGTVAMKDGYSRPGKLNSEIGLSDRQTQSNGEAPCHELGRLGGTRRKLS